jgi:hypothetical protein
MTLSNLTQSGPMNRPGATTMKHDLMALAPRGENGRFVQRDCPDLNCGGSLVLGTDRFGSLVWHCDGLTHLTDDGPLAACDYEIEVPIAVRSKVRAALHAHAGEVPADTRNEALSAHGEAEAAR